jgi:hypothetical protein
MMAFPCMLMEAARRAGIAVPPDPDDFDPEAFPHFYFFCLVQLNQPMPYAGVHWENAQIIASLSKAELRTITPAKLEQLGFE